MRRLPSYGLDARGLDVVDGPYVDLVGSVSDADCVARAMDGVDAVIHAAALHKPHVAEYSKRAFVDTNVTGTLCLIERAIATSVKAFVFTSTTSAFGRALVDATGRRAHWIDESVVSRPKNIYGATKCAAEDLCELAHCESGLPVVVLRSRKSPPKAPPEKFPTS